MKLKVKWGYGKNDPLPKLKIHWYVYISIEIVEFGRYESAVAPKCDSSWSIKPDLVLVILLDSNDLSCGGARGVMVIVTGNGHGDASSNPGQDWLHFAEH